jgi:hypothetical protein
MQLKKSHFITVNYRGNWVQVSRRKAEELGLIDNPRVIDADTFNLLILDNIELAMEALDEIEKQKSNE